MIKKYLPQTLLGRSVLILVIPLIILQAVTTFIFYNRHWDTITRHRTIDFVKDITLVVESFEKNKSMENQIWALNNVSEKLQLQTFYKKNKKLNFDIEVDGGINFSNSKIIIEAGANILVSGTTIFKENNGNIKKNINTLKLV